MSLLGKLTGIDLKSKIYEIRQTRSKDRDLKQLRHETNEANGDDLL